MITDLQNIEDYVDEVHIDKRKSLIGPSLINDPQQLYILLKEQSLQNDAYDIFIGIMNKLTTIKEKDVWRFIND